MQEEIKNIEQNDPSEITLYQFKYVLDAYIEGKKEVNYELLINLWSTIWFDERWTQTFKKIIDSINDEYFEISDRKEKDREMLLSLLQLKAALLNKRKKDLENTIQEPQENNLHVIHEHIEKKSSKIAVSFEWIYYEHDDVYQLSFSWMKKKDKKYHIDWRDLSDLVMNKWDIKEYTFEFDEYTFITAVFEHFWDQIKVELKDERWNTMNPIYISLSRNNFKRPQKLEFNPSRKEKITIELKFSKF